MSRENSGASAFFGEHALIVMASYSVEMKLNHRAIVRAKNVAHGPTAHHVADFFGHVLGVITGALELLGHRDHVKTLP